ncbi:helix-turn-helix transcriptional regulator [Streptomyces mangrovisoli]|uniref:Helix-turn-helix transcriptional regulator n=1 Tax=Streptomyces mangrovisoli TaxID=1428628 RepID=A0A1J4P7Y5_9ACTN|nr:helix-turn-helix transcriptional regulator [Streptomyces mangrovisoli]OIJ69621.1 helix-turn-helix transcriptional regulator [Streptomyces mangrovisoli]
MSASAHAPHGMEELCPAGEKLYELALHEGRVGVTRAEEAPCLLDFGLLQPAVDDMHRLEPVDPAVALHRLLRASATRIADERRREERLAGTFERLLRAGGPPGPAPGTQALTVLSGTDRINEAITAAMVEAEHETLCIQPHAHYDESRTELARARARARDQALLDRGCRIRTLYQHTQRHSLAIMANCEMLRGDVEARTLDELTDRLIVVDRAAAFIPADADGSLALEIRHPALIAYFVTTFDRLWRLATPMYPRAERQPTLGGVTPRQRAIAALLVEGHTDAVIANRLGMNVRTARVHIAKLAATLGSESRAQLGYLIARSGILDQEG